MPIVLHRKKRRNTTSPFEHVEQEVRDVVLRAKELLRDGNVGLAREIVRRIAERYPLIALDVFEEEAKKARADGREDEWAFWVEAMGAALSVTEIAPFPPPQDWFEDEKTIALGIAIGKIVRQGRRFVLKKAAQ